MASISSTPARVEYPESDGKPLGETGIHVEAIFALLDVIRNHYDGRTDASVLADMFLYYREGKPRRCVAPDVFLTLGVPDNRLRRTFRVWEEGKAPDLVIEVTSMKTLDDDLNRKFEIYRDDLSVREYFLFDPEAAYLDPPLIGYRLIDNEYEQIEPVDGRLPSEVMGVHLERDDDRLRLYDPRKGRYVPSTADKAREAQDEAREARARAEQAEAALRARESELDRLQRELETLRRASSDESP